MLGQASCLLNLQKNYKHKINNPREKKTRNKAFIVDIHEQNQVRKSIVKMMFFEGENGEESLLSRICGKYRKERGDGVVMRVES